MEGIESGSAEVSTGQRVNQSPLVDEASARNVNEPRTGPHRGEFRLAQDAARLGCGGQREHDEVCLRKLCSPGIATAHAVLDGCVAAATGTEDGDPERPSAIAHAWPNAP